MSITRFRYSYSNVLVQQSKGKAGGRFINCINLNMSTTDCASSHVLFCTSTLPKQLTRFAQHIYNTTVNMLRVGLIAYKHAMYCVCAVILCTVIM